MAPGSEEDQGDDGTTIIQTEPTRFWQSAPQRHATGRVGEDWCVVPRSPTFSDEDETSESLQ